MHLLSFARWSVLKNVTSLRLELIQSDPVPFGCSSCRSAFQIVSLLDDKSLYY